MMFIFQCVYLPAIGPLCCCIPAGSKQHGDVMHLLQRFVIDSLPVDSSQLELNSVRSARSKVKSELSLQPQYNQCVNVTKVLLHALQYSYTVNDIVPLVVVHMICNERAHIMADVVRQNVERFVFFQH